ncbi:hypothetical protein CUMW_040140 [Citrus unshiu]|nr:hypothetical protein CUMW_040140 [Citrus unshiu]
MSIIFFFIFLFLSTSPFNVLVKELLIASSTVLDGTPYTAKASLNSILGTTTSPTIIPQSPNLFSQSVPLNANSPGKTDHTRRPKHPLFTPPRLLFLGQLDMHIRVRRPVPPHQSENASLLFIQTKTSPNTATRNSAGSTPSRTIHKPSTPPMTPSRNTAENLPATPKTSPAMPKMAIANTVGSSFTGYAESGNAANDSFKAYGVSGNNPHNNFKSYGIGANSAVAGFTSYRNGANVGDDSFQSYAKSANSGKVNFANYGKTFNLGNDTFKEYGKASVGRTSIGFKNYDMGRSFKEYTKGVPVTFAGYTNLSSDANSVNRWVEPGKFFRESMLKQGNVMVMPDIRDKMPRRSFLPRSISSKLPFATSQLTQLKEIFRVRDNSSMERVILNALAECERAPSPGETKRCVGSVEDMIDFATSVLGRNVVARTTQNVNGSKRRVTISSVSGINGGKVTKSVSCHQSLYPYLLYYCHSVPKVRVYEADVLDVVSNAKINHGVAICHIDTSSWSPGHGAFVALGSGPGQIEVCHWIFENDMTWTSAD